MDAVCNIVISKMEQYQEERSDDLVQMGQIIYQLDVKWLRGAEIERESQYLDQSVLLKPSR